jgi:hypothetical protein
MRSGSHRDAAGHMRGSGDRGSELWKGGVGEALAGRGKPGNATSGGDPPVPSRSPIGTTAGSPPFRFPHSGTWWKWRSSASGSGRQSASATYCRTASDADARPHFSGPSVTGWLLGTPTAGTVARSRPRLRTKTRKRPEALRLLASRSARPERFELPTFGSVVCSGRCDASVDGRLGSPEASQAGVRFAQFGTYCGTRRARGWAAGVGLRRGSSPRMSDRSLAGRCSRILSRPV